MERRLGHHPFSEPGSDVRYVNVTLGGFKAHLESWGAMLVTIAPLCVNERDNFGI